jgi:hypothetical protein
MKNPQNTNNITLIIEQLKSDTLTFLEKNPFDPIHKGEFMEATLKFFSKGLVTMRSQDTWLDKIPSKYIQEFDGYTAYYFPGGSRMKWIFWPNVRYGIGIATKEGKEHIHFDSDAFNYQIVWTALFQWWGGKIKKNDEIITIQQSIHHGHIITPWTGWEIPAWMPHGHLPLNKQSIKFFFVQDCWFNQIDDRLENPCFEDFWRIDGKKSDNQTQ